MKSENSSSLLEKQIKMTMISDDSIKGKVFEDFLKVCDILSEKETLFYEERFRQALKFSIENKSISPAKLQRKFKIGYGIAATYCDMIRTVLNTKLS